MVRYAHSWWNECKEREEHEEQLKQAAAAAKEEEKRLLVERDLEIKKHQD